MENESAVAFGLSASKRKKTQDPSTERNAVPPLQGLELGCGMTQPIEQPLGPFDGLGYHLARRWRTNLASMNAGMRTLIVTLPARLMPMGGASHRTGDVTQGHECEWLG
jgi:hypothetical protein